MVNLFHDDKTKKDGGGKRKIKSKRKGQNENIVKRKILKREVKEYKSFFLFIFNI